jgi:hypothetical protein
MPVILAMVPEKKHYGPKKVYARDIRWHSAFLSMFSTYPKADSPITDIMLG